MRSPSEIFINVYSEKLLFLTFAIQVLFTVKLVRWNCQPFF